MAVRTLFERFDLGKPSHTNSATFLTIVQTAFDPPSPRFEHVCLKDFLKIA